MEIGHLQTRCHNLSQIFEFDFLGDILSFDAGLLSRNMDQFTLVLPAILLNPDIQHMICNG